MLRKIYQGLFISSVLAGFILMIGTVGASDLNIIDFEKIFVQASIAMLLILAGFFGLKLSGWEYIN